MAVYCIVLRVHNFLGSRPVKRKIPKTCQKREFTTNPFYNRIVAVNNGVNPALSPLQCSSLY